MKLEFSRQIFEKYSNTKFHENPTSGSRVVPCGGTDRLDEAESLFAVLRMRLKKTKGTTTNEMGALCHGLWHAVWCS